MWFSSFIWLWSGAPGHSEIKTSILNLQYVKIELCYDADFLHIRRHLLKRRINSFISSSLKVWFLSFGPQIISASEIVRFFNITYLQNSLIFWLHILYNTLVSWLEPTEYDFLLMCFGILCWCPLKSSLFCLNM